VANPNNYYEPVRVEINAKGKFRARKLNHLQPHLVVQVAYPLKLKSLGRIRYFQQREQWRITDFLFSPMVRASTRVAIELALQFPSFVKGADDGSAFGVDHDSAQDDERP
jgi:Protein of unknown function (DUF2012)